MIRPHSARDDNRDFLMRYLLSMFGPNCIIHIHTLTYDVCSIHLCMYNTYKKKQKHHASRKFVRHGNLSLVVVIWDHVVDDMDLLAAYTTA